MVKVHNFVNRTNEYISKWMLTVETWLNRWIEIWNCRTLLLSANKRATRVRKYVWRKYSPEEDVSLAKSPTHAHFALLRVNFVLDALQYQVAVFGRSVVRPQEFVERCKHFIPQIKRLVPHSMRIAWGKNNSL